MKKLLLFLLSIGGLHLLNGCGSSTPPPPPVVATHFSVTPATTTPNSGTAFMITVTALGASGQIATRYSGTLHFVSSDSNASLPADSPMNGVTATYSLTLNTAGSQSITVTDGSSLKGVSNAINVGSGTPTHLSVTAASYTATTGTPINVVVTAFDASGNTATGYSGTVHFTSSDAQAVLPANSTLTSGVGNFSATLKTSGSKTITATDTVSTSINGTSNAFNVSGPATHFIVASSSTADTRSPVTLLISAFDASNNVSNGYSGTVRITSSDSKAILPANGPLRGGQGNFQFTFETSGSQTITATDTITVSVTGTSSPIAVTATSTPAITSGNPPNGTVGSKYGPTKTVYSICSQIGGCTPCVPDTSDCGGNLPSCRANPFATCLQTTTYNGFELTGTGGVRPYTWTGSSLPPGLAIKQGFLIGGTPTPGTAATYQAMVTLNDSGQPPAPFTMTYSIVISNPPPPVVSNPALFPGATINQPFSYTFAATAGLPPYSNWKLTGTMPTGILPITSAGVLAGTPTATGAFPISVTVDDSLGQVSAAQGFNLQVYPHGFKPDGAMGAARTSHTATLLADGTLLIAGGLGLASAEKYDPSTAKFTPTASMSMPHDTHTATRLASGKVLITGGGGLGGDPVTATAELFDPATGMFTLTGSMSVARTGHNATLLADGKVLITDGGTTTAELYDPSTGKFTPTTGLLTTTRSNDTATLLPNGKVLIAGGFNSGPLTTAELYDPATETFAATGSMAATRLSHTATLLTSGPNSGKVLVAGGATTAAAEIYDPATGTFSATGSMAAPRAGQTATLLGDGTVLMAGGSDANGIIAAAELYDPNSGTFSGTGSLQTAREAHTATMLKDGTVLVTGGVNPLVAGGILATAELYR